MGLFRARRLPQDPVGVRGGILRCRAGSTLEMLDPARPDSEFDHCVSELPPTTQVTPVAALLRRDGDSWRFIDACPYTFAALPPDPHPRVCRADPGQIAMDTRVAFRANLGKNRAPQ